MADYMNEKQYTQIVMKVLEGLKNECEKFECCRNTCNFYNKAEGSCFLKQCPCDYDMTAIENGVLKIIEKEMQDETIKG